jgi:endoglucanase
MTAVGNRGPGVQDPGARRTAELLAELFPEHRDGIRADERLLTAISDARRVSGAEPETLAYAVGLEDIPQGQPVLAVLAGRCEFAGRQLRGRGEAGTDGAGSPTPGSAAAGQAAESSDPNIDEAASADAPAFPVLHGLRASEPDDVAPPGGAILPELEGTGSLVGTDSHRAQTSAWVHTSGSSLAAATGGSLAEDRPLAAPERTQVLPPVYSSPPTGAGAPARRISAGRRGSPTSGVSMPPRSRPPAAANQASGAGVPGPPRRHWRTGVIVVASVLALAVVGGGGFLASRLWGSQAPGEKAAGASASASGSPSGSATAGSSKAPFGTTPFFVRPDTIAAQWAQGADGDPRLKLVQERIANRAAARWFGAGDPADAIGDYVKSARKAGQTPVLLSFRLPGGTWCGKEPVPSAAEYRAWIEQIAVSVAGGPAVVILEPYTLSNTSCVPVKQLESRLALLRAGVTRLSALPGVAVYLDGGQTTSDSTKLTDVIKRAGGDAARGFVVNPGGNAPTQVAREYADRLSASLQTAGVSAFHYIIDTSLSGGTEVPTKDYVCNPAGARIGEDPAPLVGAGAADAYVWLRIPGMSDGKCGGSEVEQAQFDPVLAERVAG